jgi:hypothetical protein
LPNGKDVMTAARKATEPYVDFARMQLGDAEFRKETRRTAIGASRGGRAMPPIRIIDRCMSIFGDSRRARNATRCQRG